VNSLQRQLLIQYNGFKSAFSGIGYDATYFTSGLDEQLHPIQRMTVDHLFSKKRECLTEAWPLRGDEHWQKDNASRDAQIQFTKRLLAKQKDATIRALLATRLVQLESGLDMEAIGRLWSQETYGRKPEPEEYTAAREQEEGEKPIRKAKRKVKAKAARKARKAWGAKKRGEAPPSTRGIRLPSKVLEQISRPVLNGFKT
jgi:hypothetical protein